MPASAAVAVLLAGCASTRLDAQWSDPQLAPGSLRGARVMVACEAYDLVIRRICQDQMAAEVTARGGTPVAAPNTTNEAPGRPLGAEQYLPAARNAGAKAVMTHYVTQADVSVSPPSSVSFGIGGFGFGGGGGAVSTGVGVYRAGWWWPHQCRLCRQQQRHRNEQWSAVVDGQGQRAAVGGREQPAQRAHEGGVRRRRQRQAVLIPTA